MISLLASFIAGGLVRFIDGSAQPLPGLSFKIPNAARVASLWAVCAASWWIYYGEVSPLISDASMAVFTAWGATFCMLSMVVGHTAWTDWKWQPLRFALFGFAAIYTAGQAWQVPTVMALAGLSYPVLFWLDSVASLPRSELFDGPEAYARIICGGFCCSAPMFALL